MSDTVDPKINPEQAALQLVIEFIRAGKTGPISGVGTGVLDVKKAYSAFLEHLKKEG